MPTYEYECSKCHCHFDAFQTMSSEPYKTCPEELCQKTPWGKGKVKRLLGAGAGLIFKGSGFYITDYRSQGYKDSAKKDTAAGSSEPSKGSSQSKSSSGGDSKAAASVKTKEPSQAKAKNEKKASPK